MEEAQWCFGVVLVPQALGALNLYRVQWNQKTSKAFLDRNTQPTVRKLYLSHIGHGSYSRIMSLHKHKKHSRVVEKKMLDFSVVACCESWSETHWTSVERAEIWRWEMAPIKPERTGAVFLRKKWIKLLVEECGNLNQLEKALDCSYCFQRLFSSVF